MRRAMELAELGRGWTRTNPVVGAVLVKRTESSEKAIIKNLADFTQSEALADAKRGEDQRSRSLCDIRTMLPLQEKTPPCTQAVIEAGISHVFCWGGRHQSACRREPGSGS